MLIHCDFSRTGSNPVDIVVLLFIFVNLLFINNSLVVQWLEFMPLTYETRVRFPAREHYLSARVVKGSEEKQNIQYWINSALKSESKADVISRVSSNLTSSTFFRVAQLGRALPS